MTIDCRNSDRTNTLIHNICRPRPTHLHAAPRASTGVEEKAHWRRRLWRYWNGLANTGFLLVLVRACMCVCVEGRNGEKRNVLGPP